MKNKPVSLRYDYRGLVLDQFQQEALWHIENGTSLLVSAPTGTGKTLIAEFLVGNCLKKDEHVIFTAPIKALVNQKFQEFSGLFGKTNVGIATGDITINQNAPVLVVTTEILRNMLLRSDERILSLNWVIFDEIHYLNHQQRGTVWEESILLKPSWVRLLGLSATVPNIQNIADWIMSIHEEPTAVVTYQERAVPLNHLYFNQSCAAIPQEKVMQSLAEAALSDKDEFDYKGGALDDKDIRLPKRVRYNDSTHFVDLVKYLRQNRLFPALYFSFSRKGCAQKAAQIANRYDYLDNRDKHRVRLTVHKMLQQAQLEKDDIPHFDSFMDQWMRGVGVHHAGLLPIIKKTAETLLEEGLIRILFTTETFAVGVNMPVRTVCFDNLKKYDGNKHRHLTQQEYFQMAGRAGRRGMDKEGTVISLVDFGEIVKEPLPLWREQDLEPITSRFELSYNMVLNLMSQFSDTELSGLFRHTLAAFEDRANTQRIETEFQRKRRVLTQLGFVEEERVSDKGEIAKKIYIHELLLAELIHENKLRRFKPFQLGGLAASLSWEANQRLPLVAMDKWLIDVEVTRDQMAQKTGVLHNELGLINSAASEIMVRWIKGCSIQDLLKAYPVDPGDFVQMCRRAIDILRQMQSISDSAFSVKIEQAIKMIDRGVVKTTF